MNGKNPHLSEISRATTASQTFPKTFSYLLLESQAPKLIFHGADMSYSSFPIPYHNHKDHSGSHLHDNRALYGLLASSILSNTKLFLYWC
jgi:hypothetical protein